MFSQPLSVLIMFCSDSNQVHCSAASGRILWAAFPPIVYINQWGLFAPMRRHFIGLGTTAPGLLSRSHKVIYRPATLVLSCESVSRQQCQGRRFRDLDAYQNYSLSCVIIVFARNSSLLSWFTYYWMYWHFTQVIVLNYKH